LRPAWPRPGGRPRLRRRRHRPLGGRRRGLRTAGRALELRPGAGQVHRGDPARPREPAGPPRGAHGVERPARPHHPDPRRRGPRRRTPRGGGRGPAARPVGRRRARRRRGGAGLAARSPGRPAGPGERRLRDRRARHRCPRGGCTLTTNFHGAVLRELRAEVAAGCRVLASRDLSPGFLGHISLRLDDERILLRCRGPREAGLAHTTSQDVRVVTLDGEPGLPGELDGWTVPHELPLHTRILRRRPDVRCVVHAHPRRTVAADLAGLTLEPLVGAYDIPGSALVADGVPVYPRSVLVASDALG